MRLLSHRLVYRCYAMPNTTPTPLLDEPSVIGVLARFLSIGARAWGGPIAQIGLLREEVVDRDKWVSSDEFTRTMALYQALPGPEALELCVYLGMRKRGRWGGMAAGLGFLLPGLVLVLIAAWAYTTFGTDTVLVAGALIGIAPVTLALVVRAVRRISANAIKTWWHWALAIVAAVGSLALTANSVESITTADRAAITPASQKLVEPTLSEAGWAGLRAGALSFGGAYTAVPFVQRSAVGGQWITNATFIDALSVGSALPAPLVIFVAFVGFTASGLVAALVMAAAIVLPAFVITLIGHRRMEQITAHPRIHGTLDGLTAIVIGFIAATAILLAAGILMTPVTLGIFVIAMRWLARVKNRSAIVLIVLIGASLGVTSEAIAATHMRTAISFGRSAKGADLRATIFSPVVSAPSQPTEPSTPTPTSPAEPSTPAPGKPATTVLVVGQIHGDESAGIPVIRYLRTLAPQSNIRMILVNTINPDGHAARTRQNARGVDLNRNYPTNWRRAGSPFDVFYPGPAPASERETRAVMNLVREYQPQVTIWYHQHLRCIDRGGKVPDYSRRYAKISQLPLCGNGLKYRGTATSWQNATNPDSTAFVVELPAGQLSATGVRRHARAVRDVAAAAARS